MNPIPSSYNPLANIYAGEPIKENTPVEPNLNFEKSATVHYIVNTIPKRLISKENLIRRLENRINEQQVLLEEQVASGEDIDYTQNESARDDTHAQTLARDLDEDKQTLLKMNKDRDVLLSLSQKHFQSEDEIKTLISLLVNNNEEFEPKLWDIIWTMIKREAQYGDDYFVLYTSHNKNVEVRMLENHLHEQTEGHQCSAKCFSNKTFRKKTELEMHSLEEAFKTHIFTKNFFSDREDLVVNHFLCTNLTLFANYTTSAEATYNPTFLKPYKITKCSHQSIDNLYFESKVKSINDQKYGVLEQFFIRKELADKLCYISSPFGYPLSSNYEEVKKTTNEAFNAFQNNTPFNMNAIESPFVLNEEQSIRGGAVRNYISGESMTIHQYLKMHNITSENLQARLMYLPELFHDNSSVLVFSNTLDEGEGIHIMSSLNRATTGNPQIATIDKINTWINLESPTSPVV